MIFIGRRTILFEETSFSHSFSSPFYMLEFKSYHSGNDVTEATWHICLWDYSSVDLFSSVQSFGRVYSLRPQGLQHARLPCPSPTLGACSNSCPLSRWCYPTISSSIVPFSSCLQSFPASRSFPVSQFFASGGQSIGVSASVWALPMNFQDWFPLGWTGLISLQSKGFSRVFSNTTVQKYEFFSVQPSLWSNCHIHTWLLEKP